MAVRPRNDVAVLQVGNLGLRALPLATAKAGTPVAVLGFPENGPFTVTPARIGRTSVVLAEDAYGSRPVTRPITALRGVVRHGDSGAPAVNLRGGVEAMASQRASAWSRSRCSIDVVRPHPFGRCGAVSTGKCAP